MDIVQRYHKKQEYLRNLRDAAKSCLPELMDYLDDTQLQRIKTLIQSGEISLSDFIEESEFERNVVFYYNIAKPLIRTLFLMQEWHSPDIYVDCSIIDLFYRPEFCLDTTSIYNRLRLKGQTVLTSLLTTIRNPEVRRLLDSAISEERQQQFETIIKEHGSECETFIKLIEMDAFHNSIVDIDSAPDDEKAFILKDYLSDLFPSKERMSASRHLTDEEINQIEKYKKEFAASCFVLDEAGSEAWFKRIHENGVFLMATMIYSWAWSPYTEEERNVLKGFINDPICPDFKQECLDAMPQLFGVTITDIDDDILAPPRYYYSWPTLKDFLQKEHLQAYCIRKLQPDVEKDFKSEEGYEHFKRFMNQVAEYGGITNDVNMEALLQFVTGRRFDDAGKHLRWDGTLMNARILFYVVQKISADSTRTKFQYLKDDSFTIFSGIDGSEKKKLQGDKTEAKVTETIQGGKGFHDKAAELAKYYPSLFRD